MEGVRTRIITAALSAVLILNVVAPIPSGSMSGCDFRYETAEANTAVAYPVAFITFLVAAGFYTVSNSDVDYATSVGLVWDDLCEFADSSGIMDSTTLQGVLASALTSSGAVNLDIINDTAWNLLTAWANDGVTNGSFFSGENSLSGATGTGSLNGITWYYDNQEPSSWAVNSISEQYNNYLSSGYNLVWYERGAYCYMHFVPSDTLYITSTASNSLTAGNTLNPGIVRIQVVRQTIGSPTVNQTENSYATISASYATHLTTGLNVVNGEDSATLSLDNSGYLGIATQALLDGYTAENAPTGTYEAFTPTAAQLEAGYDSTALVEAIESGTEVATDISGSVSQILTQVTGLSDVFGDLRTQVQTLVTDFASQLAWAGAESFPNVMNTVIDGLGDISGGIEQGVSDLLDGLADIPGADVLSPSIDAILDGINELVNPVTVDIPAVLEGVQEGVLSIPDAMELGLENVIASINAQTLEITGAIEGVSNFGRGGYDINEGDYTMFALSADMTNGLMDSLRDKVPFCYVIRSENALGTLFTNLNQGRSFYFDIQLPYAEEPTRFDAEPFLSVRFGIFDIATTIKMALTGFICLMLLWRAYKVIERMTF